ncbi:hypothetical protein [Mucilaginibacter lappiensis]|uniref:Outer membrane protein beta-barrel domain-containing protein n=1 Tax=Mucilaginibacter lappiensis TaxID=354630 RepID=A0A841JM33_9SPHI|nr:hypothetical protein [Mucilaginibacter lappiensis]MBB6131504.1 hypothetical protein [Mucilaginibacter lappiensis]
MKKTSIITVILMTWCITHAYAQTGINYLGGRWGIASKNSYQGGLNLEFSGTNGNNLEIFADYLRKKKKYYDVMAGFAYKPLLFRNNNTSMRMRFGGAFGTDRYVFLAAPQTGIELLQALPGGVELVLGNKDEYLFFTKHKELRWRVALEVGIKIPIN